MWDGSPCMCLHDELFLLPWVWVRCRRLRWPSRSSCTREKSWRCSDETATGQPEADVKVAVVAAEAVEAAVEDADAEAEAA